MNSLQMNIQIDGDISWILEAAQDTMNATEKDFASIQSKKWYKRLWETVTFSKDNQCKMAKGVSSLAKLQEIIIRLLVVLSQDSAEISNAVKQNSDLISRLALSDTLLLREIDKIKFGGTVSIDFFDLNREQKVRIANLLIMADPNAVRNDYSKQYVSSVMMAAHITSFDNTVKPNTVDLLNREEQELLYRMIMVHRYLMDIDFDEPSEVIDYIPISMRRAKEIRTSIVNTACSVSPEFFSTFYEKTNEAYNEIDDDDILFEDECAEESQDFRDSDDIEEDTIRDVSEYEEVFISSILHIPENEEFRFEYKILHIQTTIDCEGQLEFRNCIIHYGEAERICEIRVRGSGSISVYKCTIEGHSYFEENVFLKVETQKSETRFIDCLFLNCCSFLKTNAKYIFQKCNITNYGINFIDATSFYSNEDPGIIQSTTFYYENVPEFIQRSKKERGNIISVKNIVFSDCSITGDLRIQSAEEAAQIDNNVPTFIRANHITMERAYFKGVSSIIHGCGKIGDSIFEECHTIFSKFGYYDSLQIIECKFQKCARIGLEVGNTNFLHCKFTDCFNCLISSSGTGKMNAEYCEFIRWSAKNEEKSIFTRLFSDAMIKLSRFKGKDYYSNTVKNCVFDGITAHQYFVISGDTPQNIDGFVAYVENCSFTNCTTERDDGKIIKEYASYLGLFNKRKEIKTVMVASSCLGLDHVRKV